MSVFDRLSNAYSGMFADSARAKADEANSALRFSQWQRTDNRAQESHDQNMKEAKLRYSTVDREVQNDFHKDVYQATYGQDSSKTPGTFQALQAKWGDDFHNRMRPVYEAMFPGQNIKQLNLVDAGNGKIAFETEYNGDRPKGVLTDGRKTLDQDPDDSVTMVDAQEFHDKFMPAIESITAPSVSNPFLKDVFKGVAFAVDGESLPEITEAGSTFVAIRQNEGEGQANAFLAGTVTGRTEQTGGQIPPEAVPEIESAKKGFLDHFMAGYNAQRQQPNQSIVHQYDNAEFKGELDGSTGFQRDARLAGGAAGATANVLSRSVDNIKTAAQMVSPLAKLQAPVVAATAGHAAGQAVHGYFTDEKKSATPDKPTSVEQPAAGPQPSPAFANLVEANPSKAPAPTPAPGDKGPDPTKDPAAAVQQRLDAATAGDSAVINRQRVTETQLKRSPSKVIQSPEKRADISSRMVQMGYWTQDQAMNFAQTGYISSEAMNMANYPDRMKLEMLKAEADMLKQKNTATKDERDQWVKSAKYVSDTLHKGLATISPDGKAKAANAWMITALEDGFTYYGLSRHVRYDASGNAIGSDYSPMKTEEFLLANSGIETAMMSAMSSMRHHNKELPNETIAPLVISAFMRKNSDLFRNKDDINSLAKMAVGIGDKPVPADLDNALGILEYARLANPDFPPHRVSRDMLSHFYRATNEVIEENKRHGNIAYPQEVREHAMRIVLDANGLNIPKRQTK